MISLTLISPFDIFEADKTDKGVSMKWATIERKEREGSFIHKSFGFVLIRRQEGSYAGSHRAMLKDISPRMPRPKTTNTPAQVKREMIKRFLLKAILMGIGIGE